MAIFKERNVDENMPPVESNDQMLEQKNNKRLHDAEYEALLDEFDQDFMNGTASYKTEKEAAEKNKIISGEMHHGRTADMEHSEKKSISSEAAEMKDVENIKNPEIKGLTKEEMNQIIAEADDDFASFGEQTWAEKLDASIESKVNPVLDKIENAIDPQDDSKIELKIEQENLKEDSELPRCEINKIKDLTEKDYAEAKQVASENPDGRLYTDHTELHVEMTAEKSIEVADALEKAIDASAFGGNLSEEEYAEKGDTLIRFEGNIDKDVLEAAALSHDTGMKGGYVLEKNNDGKYECRNLSADDDYGTLRINHPLNSAINVLENREQYKDAGYSDEQVDMIAVECMAHSKTSSGIRDLNSKNNWEDCFNRLDAAIEAYNKDHKESAIHLDKESFLNDESKLGQVATASLSLRVGDVSRDSGPGAITQSGEVVKVEQIKDVSDASNYKEEIKGFSVRFEETNEEIVLEKSKQVHIGEQNIVDNKTYFDENSRFIRHEIKLNDAEFAPKCTQEAIRDHLGEFATAKDSKFELNIIFDETLNKDVKDNYSEFAKDSKRDYPNISIHLVESKEV